MVDERTGGRLNAAETREGAPICTSFLKINLCVGDYIGWTEHGDLSPGGWGGYVSGVGNRSFFISSAPRGPIETSVIFESQVKEITEHRPKTKS